MIRLSYKMTHSFIIFNHLFSNTFPAYIPIHFVKPQQQKISTFENLLATPALNEQPAKGCEFSTAALQTE
jgi:hypothetical protein